jgi:hypothetical protein
MTRMAAEADRRVQHELMQLEQQLSVERETLHRQLGRASELLVGLSEPVAARFVPLGRVLQRF